MKKILALILALVMVFALAACGSSDKPTGNEQQPAGDATIEPLTIKFSSTYQQQETGGLIIQHFIDKVAEMSGGAITVEIAWGGTLFDATGELDAVIDGVVDMIALGHMPHLDTLPYLSFPGFAPNDSQNALDYFNHLMFDNAETAALIQGEAADLGIKYLNVIPGGANAFCVQKPFSTIDEMVANSSAFGNMDAAIFEMLGFQVTSVMPPDTYDALNRGLIDGTQMALAPMLAMAWYEVAPYWCLDNTYTAGNPFTVNLDWWEGLSKAQQDCIQAAADETEAYAAGLYTDAIANDVKVIEEATGNKFVELSDADKDKFWAACFEAKAADAMNRAETHGVTEGMTTILEAAAKFTGYDWKH